MLSLRPAAAEDLELVQRWDEEPDVVASDPDDDWQWDVELRRNPTWREQLIAEIDGRPIGFVQIIDPAEEESHYWGEIAAGFRAIDLWIGEASDRGQGYGTEIMRQSLVRCFANPEVTAVLVDPLAVNLRARQFYERCGFRAVGPRQFGSSACMVYQLDRVRFAAD